MQRRAALLAVVAVSAAAYEPKRRAWLQRLACAAVGTATSPARALDALPATTKKFTALAPLGPADAKVGGTKRIARCWERFPRRASRTDARQARKD